MISDVPSFLRWFEGVHRRTLRDVSILPSEAETWSPRAGSGEEAWGVPQLVQHLAEGRLYFAEAFAGRGWVWDPWPVEVRARHAWAPALDDSMQELRARLESAPADRLQAKIELIGDPGRTVSGWRVLMMMAEHEIAHRAQIGAYAGLNGWPVAQIFDRENEWVRAQRDDQLRRYRTNE
jgi:uncharacterized damage-inducible protein DinB